MLCHPVAQSPQQAARARELSCCKCPLPWSQLFCVSLHVELTGKMADSGLISTGRSGFKWIPPKALLSCINALEGTKILENFFRRKKPAHGTYSGFTSAHWDKCKQTHFLHRPLPTHITPIYTFSKLLERTGIAGVTLRPWQQLPEQKGEMTAALGACPGVCSANPQAFIDYKPCPKIISRHLK